jgi:hypothetical protein
MKHFSYNDMAFAIDKTGNGWTITRQLPDGTIAVVGAELFQDIPDHEAVARAQTLVKTIFPVGLNIVGPDVAHPNRVGDLKIVGPNVNHPNFIYWNKDSTSLAK